MRMRLLVLGLLLGAMIAPAGAAPAPFRAGFADRDITPSPGMERPGGYGKAYHRDLHDACKVRAAVFDDGTSKVAIVGIDSLFIRKATVEAVRSAVEKACGIPAGSILISASHTHSGGPTGFFLPGELPNADDLVKRLIAEETVIAHPEYLAKVQQGIIDAIVAAHAALTPARCGVGVGHEDKVSFNRRFLMKNGQSWTHPGQGNPDIVRPAGPIDPQVGVIGAWAADDGRFLGCIVNFACHATTSPGGTSADYIYYIEKTVRGLMGGDAVVVFLPGAGGDVTQVDNRSPYQIKQSGEVASRIVGGRVGAEAVKVLLSMEQGAGPMGPLAASQTILQIPRRAPSAENLARAHELVRADKKSVDLTEWTFAKETVILAARIADEPVAPVEVQAVQVGPAVFLSCPAEYFCQYGLDIKAGSPFPFTFPVSMANECVGYVPTEEAFGPHGGGYETRLTSYSNLETKAGRTIADTLIAMSQKLKPGDTPRPPALPPFKGAPWAYGNVPPQKD